MGIGACVVLIASGAILTFATDLSVSGIDLTAVGVILMAAGAVGLLVTLQVHAPRRQERPRPAREPYAAPAEQYPPPHAQAGYASPPQGGYQPHPRDAYGQQPPPPGYRDRW
jgi:hypothetical protein